MLKSFVNIMNLNKYPSIFIYIIVLLSTMSTVTPKHKNANKDWKYINRIELQAVHTQQEIKFKPSFDRQGFAIKKALLTGLYVDDVKEDDLQATAMDTLKDMILTVLIGDLSIFNPTIQAHLRSLVDNNILLLYSDQVTKSIKMQNASNIGTLFDSACNVTNRGIISLDVAVLWFDKTDAYYDICKWEQITKDQTTNWEYCPGKDSNKNNPQAAINLLTTQVNNFVQTSAEAEGTTATTFDFSFLPKSSQKKYHDHLNIKKLFTEDEVNKKLEDPNNSGQVTFLQHTSTINSVVYNQFGILQTLSERNQRQYNKFIKHFSECTDIDDLGLIDWCNSIKIHCIAYGVFIIHYFALDPQITYPTGFVVNDNPTLGHLPTSLTTLVERWSKSIHQGLALNRTFGSLQMRQCDAMRNLVNSFGGKGYKTLLAILTPKHIEFSKHPMRILPRFLRQQGRDLYNLQALFVAWMQCLVYLTNFYKPLNDPSVIDMFYQCTDNPDLLFQLTRNHRESKDPTIQAKFNSNTIVTTIFHYLQENRMIDAI